MKLFVKIVVILALVYVGIVVLFESLLGYYQPANQSTLVITTTDDDGQKNDRVLSLIEDEGQLYVAANHWPRAWYREALENPQVGIVHEETSGNYLAVPMTGADHDRLHTKYAHPVVFLLLTGFPPRYFLRLDPVNVN